jgi:hypothetical protein
VPAPDGHVVIGSGAHRRHLRAARRRGAAQGLAHPDGGFEKLFCRECGAQLFSRNPDNPNQMSIRMSAFDGDPGVRPSFRAFVAYAAPWEPIPDDGLERYDERKPRASDGRAP